MEQNVSKFDEEFIKHYHGCNFEVDVEYPTNLRDLHNDLPFLLERMKTNKCEKLVCNLCDKKLLFI